MKTRTPKETLAIQTKVVLPHETNSLGKLFGGALLAWMDEIAAVSAHRHSKRVVVTASINNVSFGEPIDLGAIVTLEAKVSRAYSSSMEVIIDVFVEDRLTGDRVQSNQAIYTFVAVDQNGGPINVPELIPETEEEKKRYDAALRRRQLSLVLAGKLDPSDATELKSIFYQK
ncbi:MAG: acyl-CoA thioesterase [Crocinitomicaceae bacterium]|nr:acyl-CoA thioesterase [Crocinitomicaceae bacterium]